MGKRTACITRRSGVSPTGTSGYFLYLDR